MCVFYDYRPFQKQDGSDEKHAIPIMDEGPALRLKLLGFRWSIGFLIW